MLLFFISMVFPLLSLFYHFDFGLLFSGLSLALTPICTKDSPGGAKIFSPFFCGFFAKINLSFFWFFSLFPLIFINLLLTPYRKLSGQRRVLWPSWCSKPTTWTTNRQVILKICEILHIILTVILQTETWECSGTNLCLSSSAMRIPLTFHAHFALSRYRLFAICAASVT